MGPSIWPFTFQTFTLGANDTWIDTWNNIGSYSHLFHTLSDNTWAISTNQCFFITLTLISHHIGNFPLTFLFAFSHHMGNFPFAIFFAFSHQMWNFPLAIPFNLSYDHLSLSWSLLKSLDKEFCKVVSLWTFKICTWANKILNHETFEKLQCFLPSWLLIYIHITIMQQHDTCSYQIFVIVYASWHNS
jgi:hypothetical protein